jgi:hypothetical protein
MEFDTLAEVLLSVSSNDIMSECVLSHFVSKIIDTVGCCLEISSRIDGGKVFASGLIGEGILGHLTLLINFSPRLSASVCS